MGGKQLTVGDIPFSNVSGTVSKELTQNAIWQVLGASLLIVLYLAVRFSMGGLKEGFKYGICAVIALLHDVLVLWGSFAILGLLFGWQVDSLFVTAMLTVIGFSVHDTIIVFDRVRENLTHRQKGETFSDLTDRSIDQTISRSIRTSLTVVMTLLALFFLGGSVIHQFAGALLIGIISGTYSSIFNASVLLVMAKGNDVTTGDAVPVSARPDARRRRGTRNPERANACRALQACPADARKRSAAATAARKFTTRPWSFGTGAGNRRATEEETETTERRDWRPTEPRRARSRTPRAASPPAAAACEWGCMSPGLRSKHIIMPPVYGRAENTVSALWRLSAASGHRGGRMLRLLPAAQHHHHDLCRGHHRVCAEPGRGLAVPAGGLCSRP